MPSKPIRVFYSPLRGRFYATRAYRIKDAGNNKGVVTITGEKFDVTDDIGAAVIEHEVEFRPVSQESK